MSSILIAIGLAFVILAGAIHVFIFLLESVLWRSRSTWRGFGIRSAEDAEVIRPWALNQGFYNLFLAVGAIWGGIASISSPPELEYDGSYEPADPAMFAPLGLDPWASVAVFAAACMVAAALVLIISSRGKLLRGAVVQGAAPLIGLALIGIGLAV
jgi:putative membrane protein